MRHINVACIQTGAASDDIAENVARALDLLEQACLRQAALDLAVFNELFNSRFFAVEQIERFDHFFESIPGKTTDRLSEAARKHNVNIVAGLAEKSSAGHYYNSAVVIDRRGEIVGVYRKTHVPLIAAPAARATYERNYFRPGADLPVFQLDCAKIGILICYDRHFPEAFRTLSLRGAEIVAVPAGARSWNANWRSGIWEALLRTMAYVNGVFVVAVNRDGNENGTSYTGDSMIVSPVGGQIIERAAADLDDCVVIAELPLDEVVRCAETTPFRRDMRDDLYDYHVIDNHGRRA